MCAEMMQNKAVRYGLTRFYCMYICKRTVLYSMQKCDVVPAVPECSSRITYLCHRTLGSPVHRSVDRVTPDVCNATYAYAHTVHMCKY